MGKTSRNAQNYGPSPGSRCPQRFASLLPRLGHQALTAYAFSTENWGRPSEEVEFLMTLFERVLRQELREMMQENVRIRFVGNLHALPPSLRDEIERSMAETEKNQGIQFTVATNYGDGKKFCRPAGRSLQKWSKD